jgi:hypothetical protein
MSSNERQKLTQAQKYMGFKAAFNTIQLHRQSGSFLAGYVVAFSVFEDRLTAAVMLTVDLQRGSRPRGHLKHYEKVTRLEKAGHINDLVAEQWRKAGDLRNNHLHEAMWRVDAISESDVDSAIQLARAADKLASRLKRKLKSVTAKEH